MTDTPALAAPTAPALSSYGGFRLGDMHLALPLTALREVVPLYHLLPLPCRLESVIGAIDLRGTLVPVLDLWRALGRPSTEVQAMAEPCVLITVCEGQLIGLLAAAVTGIFEASLKGATAVSGSTMDLAAGEGLPSLFGGSLQREGETHPLSLICPDVLARWPGLPLIEDPEPQRSFRTVQALQGEHDAKATDEAAVDVDEPIVLMACGGLVFGLAALDVFATLPDVRLESSALGGGYCRGVVRHAGTEVPALDLAELCGLKPQTSEQLREGVLLRVGDGYLALLIEKVLNVIGIQPTEWLPLPRMAMPHTAWCKSLLPARLLRDSGSDDPGYLLDGERLRANPHLLGLARLRAGDTIHSGQGSSANGADTASAVATSTERERLITFDVGVEMGARLTQVVRVLSFVPPAALGDLPGHVMGVAIDQERSIPVLHLSRLLGLSSSASEAARTLPPAPLNVLVVQSGDDLVGYAVPKLVSIEEAAWVIDRPSNAASGRRQLALVGSGPEERTVRVLDLVALP